MGIEQAAPRALHETNADRFASIEDFLKQADSCDACPATAQWISGLALAWAGLDELRDSYGVPAQPTPDALRALLPETEQIGMALGAVRTAALVLRQHGYVLSVQQRPLKPLAMGHYETVIAAFPGRGVVA